MRHAHRLSPRRFGVVTLAAIALTFALAASAHAWEEGAIQNVSTGRCLRDYKTGPMEVGVCDGTTHTLWIQSGYSNHWTRFQNVASGRCLDDDGWVLTTFGCHADSEGTFRDYQSWSPSGMVAGVPNIQRWQNLFSGNCLADSTRTGLYSPRCVLHTSSAWETQAWRWSHRASG